MSDTKSQIVFEQSGLGSVLKHNHLVVPPNQREYSWEERHVNQLLQDFSKAIADGELGYFLGTIVTIPRQSGILEVVDGQQRLATTAILLAAIRDYLIGKDDMLVESITTEFLTGIDRVKRARVPHLKLNVDDNELFGWVLSKDGAKPASSKPSHQRIDDAYDVAARHVKAIVSTMDAKDHGDILEKWVSFIEHRALAVLVRVPDDANAYKMFETLNDRGLRTSQADLIKNFLFGKAGERFQEVQTRWSFMRSALESLGENDITVNFLRHALIVMRGHLRESQVYEVVQGMVKSDQQAVACASTLETLASAYVATFNPESERWNGFPDSVRRSIEVLNLLDIKPLRPLLLAVAAKFDKKDAALAFQFAVSLAVRLVIASGTRSGSIEQAIAHAAFAVFSGATVTALAMKKSLVEITPSNEEFRAAVEIAKVSNARFARYYLRSLEMAAKNEPEPWFVPTDDRSIINLEHILPKKPMGNWPLFTTEEAELWLNRLGNQALMRASDNSDSRSGPFEDKKKIYEKSPYALTSQVATASTWTPDAIATRQKSLAEIAVRTWPV